MIIERPDTKPEFIKRCLNDDTANGVLAAGYLMPASLPARYCSDSAACYSCSFVLSGSLSLRFGNGDVLKLKKGDVFQLSNGWNDVQCRCENTDTQIYQICFGALTGKALHSAGLLRESPVFSVRIRSYLTSWMPALTDQLKNTPQSELFEVYLSIQKFTIHLHQESLKNESRDHTMLIESAKQLLFDACLSNDYSFPKMAASLGLGYETFRKLFKEMTGLSPLQYLLENKFHYAQRYLTEGMSVKETAAAVGYADPYIFSRQFKKYIGDSPSRYKSNF